MAEEPQTSNIKPQTANFAGGVAGAAAAFTLIEIIVVIMVLTVLLLSALPAFRSARSNALRQTAAVESAEIASAVAEYRRVYGTWPCEEEAKQSSATVITAGPGDNDAQNTYDLDIDKVLRVLRGDADYLKFNPRGIAFLELSGSCYRKKDSQSDKVYAYDPWGKPYVLVMARAVNSSSKLSANVSRIEGGIRYGLHTSGDAYTIDIPEDVAVFSWGDPLAVTNSTMPTRIVGSWSMR